MPPWAPVKVFHRDKQYSRPPQCFIKIWIASKFFTKTPHWSFSIPLVQDCGRKIEGFYLRDSKENISDVKISSNLLIRYKCGIYLLNNKCVVWKPNLCTTRGAVFCLISLQLGSAFDKISIKIESRILEFTIWGWDQNKTKKTFFKKLNFSQKHFGLF